jgi:PAS domain-containing protein
MALWKGATTMRSYHHYKYLVYPFLIISVLVALQCLQSIYGVLPAHQSHVAIDQQTFFLAGLVLFTMIILVCHLLSRDTEKMVIGRTDYSSGAWPGYHDPTTRETAHRDITTAASLSEERTAFLEHLLQNVEESILLINLNGEIVYYNEKARNYLIFLVIVPVFKTRRRFRKAWKASCPIFYQVPPWMKKLP